MSRPSLTPEAFALIEGLIENNDRAWFAPRKAEFLELKSFVVQLPLQQQHWLDGSVVDEVVRFNKLSADLALFGMRVFAFGNSAPKKRGA